MKKKRKQVSMKNVHSNSRSLEWDAAWPGPQVIVEVSEKAPNANGTNIDGNHHFSFQHYPFFLVSAI